ncbi:hypothetical protein N656DRAFT_285795 [Canariomyces notabilis]|uniref:Uncharacterized protein n=1 Tax=Canariomyces notabilis TaxID=2074819 RepID=A0AAN6TAF5_9PEZI|nr:hypothetical protein N656DRAFT_285795 [Canariomyces arenarius]
MLPRVRSTFAVLGREKIPLTPFVTEPWLLWLFFDSLATCRVCGPESRLALPTCQGRQLRVNVTTAHSTSYSHVPLHRERCGDYDLALFGLARRRRVTGEVSRSGAIEGEMGNKDLAPAVARSVPFLFTYQLQATIVVIRLRVSQSLV